MAKKLDRVVIVMPTFNEAKNIAPMVEKLFQEEFPKIKNADMHLLVVDASSPDGTSDVVKKYQKKHNKLHLLSKEKGGLGADYIAGFKYAIKELSADAVMEMDADGQHPADHVARMVDAYVGGADYVIGARYIKGGSVPKEWALSRRMVSFFGNLFIRLVLLKPSLHDLTTGFRLTRVKGVLDKIDLDNIKEQKRFAYKVDLLYQSIKRAKKVEEVPLNFKPRILEQSKFNTKEMIATFKLAIYLGIMDKKRFIKFGIVGFVGYLVNAIGLEILSKAAISATIASNFEDMSGVLGFMGEPSAWAAALATELAIISNFTFNNLWTFKEVKIRGPLMLIRKFLEFNLSSMGAIVIQFVVIGMIVFFFGDTTLVRQLGLLVAMPLVMAFNYTMYNLFIWKTWGKKGKKKS